jgi:uridine kinase
VAERSEVLFIGGRSGVGKTSVALELHWRLAEQQVKHCVIEGDTLDQAYPPPWEHGLAEQNLSAIWNNYRALGYWRLIYTNTVSVLYTEALTAAMGDDPLVGLFAKSFRRYRGSGGSRGGKCRRRSSFT